MPGSDIPIETLIQQLHGPDWMARCDAARLLGQSRDPRAVDALLPDLHDSDWRVRRNAAQALGALRDGRAVEPLIQALNDRTMTVRQRAIVALGRIKDPQALPVLLEVFLEGKRESYDAAKAIRKFGKKAFPEMVKVFESTNNQQLGLLLVEMKYQGSFDLILKLLESPEPPTRLRAIVELGKLGDKKAIPYLMEQFSDTDPMIQGEAVRALGSLGAVQATPRLLDLLIDDELYGPRSNLYHAVTEAFQMFSGVANEIKNAFPGTYPAMFNMGGAPISMPEAIELLGNNQSHLLKNVFSGLQDSDPKLIEFPGISPEVINKVREEMAWKVGVMFADASDASQDRVKRLIELLQSESLLTALTLPWYTKEESLNALAQATHDPEETVRKAATWAFHALQKVLLYRKQAGL